MSIQVAIEHFLTTFPSGPIVVAYSGGVDSHVLLHALHQYSNGEQRSRISAKYIHHGLSAHASDWQRHCQSVCQALDVSFSSRQVKVDQTQGLGLEAAARDARYAALTIDAKEGTIVLLGQHQDDQVETFLLQLKRGSGPSGLSAMGQEKRIRGVTFVRPLLSISRNDILNYAKHHKLQWIEDESNASTVFDRNFLRHDVLPTLTERWPSFARTVSRSAKLCGEQQALIDEVTSDYLKHCLDDDGLSLTSLGGLSPLWQKQVIRAWLQHHDIDMPSEANLERILTDVISARDDAQPHVELKQCVIRRYQDNLVLCVTPPLKCIHHQWFGERVIPWGPFHQIEIHEVPLSINDFPITWDVTEYPLVIKNGDYAQRYKPENSPHSKTLSQWFKQWQIPPWERSSIPQVLKGDKLMGLLGHSKAKEHIPTNEQLSAKYYLHFAAVPRL